MKFEIDFNYGYNDNILEQLGAVKEEFDEYDAYFIVINNFEDLEKLLKKLDKITNDTYSAIVSFDNPTIYLDNKI